MLMIHALLVNIKILMKFKITNLTLETGLPIINNKLSIHFGDYKTKA